MITKIGKCYNLGNSKYRCIKNTDLLLNCHNCDLINCNCEKLGIVCKSTARPDCTNVVFRKIKNKKIMINTVIDKRVKFLNDEACQEINKLAPKSEKAQMSIDKQAATYILDNWDNLSKLSDMVNGIENDFISTKNEIRPSDKITKVLKNRVLEL